MARPRKRVSPRVIERLASIHCTMEEMAAFHGVSLATMKRRIRRPGFAVAIERGRARGMISLRRIQMRLAEGGNAPWRSSWGSSTWASVMSSAPKSPDQAGVQSRLETFSELLGLSTLPSSLLSSYSPELVLAAKVSPAGLASLATRKQTRPWRFAAHLAKLNRALMAVAARRIRRLMVFLPPRHGKSELISKYFPASYLGSFPDDRVILCSYNDTFTGSWGRKCRDVLEEWGPALWRVRVSQTSSAGDDWTLEKRQGGMVTAGRGSGISGRGAEVLIIDDPIKDAKEAASQTLRHDLMEWYRSAAYTRLQPDGCIVLVQTRWHEADLAGQLLADAKEGGDQWEVLSLPALNDDGQALWPEMFPVEELERIRRAIGGYFWSALYQQRPQPATGTIFKREWFRYYWREQHGDQDHYVLAQPDGSEKRVRVSDCGVFQICDPAATAKEENDFFVLMTWAVTPDAESWVDDLEQELLEFPRGRYDDQVDTVSYAGILLAQGMAQEHTIVRYHEPERISPY